MMNFLRKKYAHIFLLCFAVFGLFSPLIFKGMVVADEERLGFYYPLVFSYQRAVAGGESFLWDPTHYGGFPSYLNVFAGALYPLHYLLVKFLPAVNMYGLAIAIAAAAGVVFAYLFGRKNDLSLTASVILAFGYFTGQAFGAFTTGLSYANGFLVLPVMLYSCLRARRSNTWESFLGSVALGGIGCAIGFLAGFPQTVLYGMAFAGVYALFIDHGSDELGIRRWRGSASFLSASGLGALLASPQLAASFAYIPFSVRTADYTAQVSEGIWPSQFLSLFIPEYVRIPFLVSGTSGIFIGILGVFFAVLALIFFRDRDVRFFGVSYFVMLGMALAVPGISFINNYLPFFSRVSNVSRWMMVAVFPLSFLAAKGYDAFTGKSPDTRPGKAFDRFLSFSGIISWLIPLGLAVMAGAVSWLGHDSGLREAVLDILLRIKGGFAGREIYAEVFGRALEDMGRIFNFADLRFLVLLAVYPAAFFLVRKFLRTRDIPAFSRNILVFTVFCAVFFGASNYPDIAVGGEIFLEEPEIVRAWKERGDLPGEFRFVPFLTGEAVFREIFSKRSLSPEEVSRVHREILTGQVAAVWGDYENMQGFEPLRSLRANQLIDTVLSPHALKVFDPELLRSGGRIDQKENTGVLRDATPEEKRADILQKVPLLSMLNVKYLVSLYPLDDERLREVTLAKNDLYGATLRLYENIDVMPRTYLARDPVFWEGSDPELLIAISQEKNFREHTYIEDCDGCEKSMSHADDSVKILRNSGGSVEIAVETERGSWLVVSNANLPGWTAEMDGERVSIHTANYLFQAVFVPRGSHKVLLEYKGSFGLLLERFGI